MKWIDPVSEFFACLGNGGGGRVGSFLPPETKLQPRILSFGLQFSISFLIAVRPPPSPKHLKLELDCSWTHLQILDYSQLPPPPTPGIRSWVGVGLQLNSSSNSGLQSDPPLPPPPPPPASDQSCRSWTSKVLKKILISWPPQSNLRFWEVGVQWGPAAVFEQKFPTQFHPLASQWTSPTEKSNKNDRILTVTWDILHINLPSPPLTSFPTAAKDHSNGWSLALHQDIHLL